MLFVGIGERHRFVLADADAQSHGISLSLEELQSDARRFCHAKCDAFQHAIRLTVSHEVGFDELQVNLLTVAYIERVRVALSRSFTDDIVFEIKDLVEIRVNEH